ncbi:MAG TPA: hypothetical protein DE179_03425 [Oceanospirillaceae bacterium]|nr:hypothetical protein [Oceanospirillaceae bacterium]
MSEWLRDSFSFCRTYWWAIIALVVPVAAVREWVMVQTDWYSIGADMSGIPDMFGWSIISLLLLESFLQISLILLVQGILNKDNPSFVQRSSRALVMMLPFILMELMMGFAVAAGMLLLIVPGIWVLVRLSLAPTFMVVQGAGALASLKQSWKYSRGYGWDLFFGLVVTTLVSIVPSMFMLEGVDTSAGVLSNAVLSIVGSCLAVWGLVFFYRAFDYVQANPRFIDEEA